MTNLIHSLTWYTWNRLKLLLQAVIMTYQAYIRVLIVWLWLLNWRPWRHDISLWCWFHTRLWQRSVSWYCTLSCCFLPILRNGQWSGRRQCDYWWRLQMNGEQYEKSRIFICSRNIFTHVAAAGYLYIPKTVLELANWLRIHCNTSQTHDDIQDSTYVFVRCLRFHAPPTEDPGLKQFQALFKTRGTSYRSRCNVTKWPIAVWYV